MAEASRPRRGRGVTVVVDHELGDVGQESDEVLAAGLPAFADLLFGDVVSTPRDPLA
jgi:hypothetical protein